MRIAMVSEHASPLAPLGGIDAGGQNVHVRALSLALAGLGHDVIVYTRRTNPTVPDQVRIDRRVTVDHVRAGPPVELPKDELLPHMGAFADHLRARWSRQRPDVAHAHFWMSGLAAVLAARPLGTPVVQTFHALGSVKRRHQGTADTSPPERIRLERTLGRSVARVAATCSDEVFELVRLGVPRSAVSVVPCGVDTAAFTPDGPREQRSARHRLVVVGRLVPRKGVATVIRSLPALPETELVVAGGPPPAALDDDPEAAALRRCAHRVGVGDRVKLIGRVDRDAMPALLRSANAVVCVPRYEPFGMVPLEAMACGVPVVASAVGGLTDTVVHGVTGLHVPPDRPDAVARALRVLVRDEATRVGFGSAGRDRVEARYSWPRIATETVRLYERVLGSTGATTGAGALAGSRR